MAKPKPIRSLKPEYAKLEKKEPWSHHELTSFPARQRNFIRGIQITHNMEKQQAIDYFARSNLTSKERFKELEKTVKTRLEKYAASDSGGKHVHPIFTTNDLKKEQGILKKRVEKNDKTIKLKKKKQEVSKLPVDKWIKNDIVKKNVNEKQYQRVLKGHKLHPYASKFELQHGINSKASEKYRKMHGRPIKYEYND
jgi:ABC-type Fe3+/spermidine/putrescine transport system ATPase subunit